MPSPGKDRTVTDDRLLLEFVLGSGPAFFASEFEEDLDLSRQRISQILDELEGEGYVASKKASGRRLWWLTEKGEQRVAKAARERFQEDG